MPDCREASSYGSKWNGELITNTENVTDRSSEEARGRVCHCCRGWGSGELTSGDALERQSEAVWSLEDTAAITHGLALALIATVHLLRAGTWKDSTSISQSVGREVGREVSRSVGWRGRSASSAGSKRQVAVGQGGLLAIAATPNAFELSARPTEARGGRAGKQASKSHVLMRKL